MIKRPNTNAQRQKRHKRVRAKVFGTTQRPRLNVFRSEKNIYAQIIDDVAGNTLVSASSLDKEIEGNGGNMTEARAVGKLVQLVGNPAEVLRQDEHLRTVIKTMFASGKINTVVMVVGAVLIGIAIWMFVLDQRIGKLEKNAKDKK